MPSTEEEILELEEQLRQAELGPDADFFERALADDAVLVSDGEPAFAKSRVVEAHRPDRGPKFTRVEMTGIQVISHGDVAVVTCTGRYETAQAATTLDFMRVWMKKAGRWQIIAASIASQSSD